MVTWRRVGEGKRGQLFVIIFLKVKHQILFSPPILLFVSMFMVEYSRSPFYFAPIRPLDNTALPHFSLTSNQLKTGRKHGSENSFHYICVISNPIQQDLYLFQHNRTFCFPFNGRNPGASSDPWVPARRRIVKENMNFEKNCKGKCKFSKHVSF